ncbi:PREDICTED: protein maelstrom 2-like [Trachymyrmex cornetzi]|uniref:protein maelstrom 2-like n=1 Tax=Trachymyrmex cornetzi TaxID=471704 RepID=UPI00084F1327|nr:PREDICTED: protein maelstrom 2-like [Trachymyrmex cornetzi]XP_018362689.1 PREDICTED: protein maelstrom 2-like [Trachymyrmex cornetzi]
MPKNKSKSAFFFFMADWKKREEAHGRVFSNGFKDVQQDPECNAEWQGLTKQEKGRFEAMAKNDKITSQISDKGKKTSLGESLIMLQLKEKEAIMFIKNMQENIKVIIDTAVNLNFLAELKFCFVHVNWFFCMIVNNTPQYFPAEYTFGVFSLKNGIEDVHHTIVSAKIPLGYRREALEISQNSHKIPVEYEGGETDFAVMYDKLANFLESRKIVDQYPYLFTRKTFTREAQSLIARLCDAAQQDKEQFKIYELESLFVHLANELFKKRKDRDMDLIPVYAHKIFENYTYRFDKGFECHFHKYVDGGPEYCSTSVLQQWAWTLCDEFCAPLNIEMQPGIHQPDRFDRNPNHFDKRSLVSMMNNLRVRDVPQATAGTDGVLSMTGVSEQHRWNRSSRTYQEEMRRRNESKPVQVIDCSKFQDGTSTSNDKSSITESASKPAKISNVERTEYLNERPLRPPNIDPRTYITSVEDLIPTDDENFPPIGGRGVSNRSRTFQLRKAPLGKGQGHT